MLLVAPVREDRRVPIDPEALRTMQDDPDLRHRVNVVRSEIPAVTHVDYSARIQTVDEERNPRFDRLLEAFDRLTGCPVLVNTSFNVRGEPIVCTPEDAYRCFLATDMDVLVLEDIVITKDAAARQAGEAAASNTWPSSSSIEMNGSGDAGSGSTRGGFQCNGLTSSFDPPAKTLRQFAGLWLVCLRRPGCLGRVRSRPRQSGCRLGGPGPDDRPAGPRLASVDSAGLRGLDGPGVPDRLDRLATDPGADILRPVHSDRPDLPAYRPRPAPSRPPAGAGILLDSQGNTNRLPALLQAVLKVASGEWREKKRCLNFSPLQSKASH